MNCEGKPHSTVSIVFTRIRLLLCSLSESLSCLYCSPVSGEIKDTERKGTVEGETCDTTYVRVNPVTIEEGSLYTG